MPRAPLAATALCAALFLAGLSGRAGADVGLTVQPLVLQFSIVPGGEAVAQVRVNNSGSEPLRVTVQQIDWRTLVDGTVKMERVGAEGANSLNPYLRISTPGLVLGPGETRLLAVSARLPAGLPAKDGTTWGGFFIRGSGASGPLGAFGPAATVMAYNTIGAPKRHMDLLALRVSPVGHGSLRVFARLRNTGENFIRPSARVMIEQAGRVVTDTTLGNSVVFAGDLRVIEHDFGDLPPGRYHVEITFDYGGDTLVEGATDGTVR
jgi:hypothetical protein